MFQIYIIESLLKKEDNILIYIDLGKGLNRMGGSVFSRNELFDECPNGDYNDIINTFNMIQTLIKDRIIVSGHDKSEGGLITTLCEMAFAGIRVWYFLQMK